MEIINIVTLSLSGLLLLMVGSSRLSNPIKNYSKNSGIQLAEEVNLLNEIRGVSALMLLAGILILLGTIVGKMTTISLAIGTLVFIGFAIGRLVSIRLDGKPNPLIFQGLIFELVLGGANAFCLGWALM